MLMIVAMLDIVCIVVVDLAMFLLKQVVKVFVVLYGFHFTIPISDI